MEYVDNLFTLTAIVINPQLLLHNNTSVCRGSRIRKAVTNIFFDAIKRAVLSPSYMREAWQKELETIAEDGLTPDEMLVMALEEGSERMPFFSGCSVYPIFPGAASK